MLDVCYYQNFFAIYNNNITQKGVGVVLIDNSNFVLTGRLAPNVSAVYIYLAMYYEAALLHYV